VSLTTDSPTFAAGTTAPAGGASVHRALDLIATGAAAGSSCSPELTAGP